MKKSIFITVFSIIFFSTTAISQCVSCQDNFIDLDAYASAIGQFNTATGHASFAMGYKSKAIGFASGAFGFNSEAHAAASFALGRMIKASATQSIVLGSGYMPSDYLINNNPYSLMIGFNSTAPTFFISRSPSNSQQKNRTGKVGIGNVTEPEAKLHIRADDNENAELYIQSHLWNSASIASIFIGNKNYGVEANGRLGLVFNSENNYVFDNGNVGIGTTDPLHRLHVNGNIMLSSNQSSILFAADTKGEWGEWGIEYQNGGLNFWKPYGSNNFGNYFLFLSDKGNVGIGTESPQEKLDVKGTILTNGFKMPQLGIDDGYVLTADRSGNSKWMPSQNLWQLDKYNNIYYLEGNVGIGTDSPTSKFEVKSNSSKWAAIIRNTHMEGKGLLVQASHASYDYPILELQDYYENSIFTALPNRQCIIIGNPTNLPYGYKLYVEEGIITEKVKVELVSNWADFVFEKDYKLRSIGDLEIFIKENKHLPDIPSANDVKENGIDLGEMDAKLLQKIEELTLYIIDMSKNMEAQQQQIEELKNELENKK